MTNQFFSQIQYQVELLQAMMENSEIPSALEYAINLIVSSLLKDKPLLVAGNGGSAADALHISGELVGRFLAERQAFNVICLNANVSALTALGNDYSFSSIFSRQVEAHCAGGGVLWLLSTSGNSANVVNAAEVARARQVSVIAFTGAGGGRLRDFADVLVEVPSTATPRIQEIHVSLYHYVCERVESELALVHSQQP